MPDALVKPWFLNADVASRAIRMAVDAAFQSPYVEYMLKRKECHVVVLGPAMKDGREGNYPEWPDYPTKACVIDEISFGDKALWPHKFDEIARCKALQLWTSRNDGRTDSMPHLLFPGDTPFWGGVKRDGIVVACSGVQPWFDRMIAGMTADICIATAYEDFVKWKAEHPNADFV